MHKRMPYKCLQSEQVRRTYGGVRKALWTGRYRRTVANKKMKLPLRMRTRQIHDGQATMVFGLSTQELEVGSTEYNDR